MTLREILTDIHALEEDMLAFERKYGVRSETSYAAYVSGEEPEDDAWVLDWSEWAGTYEILQERRDRYQKMVETLLQERVIPSLSHLIGHTARRDPLPVAS